MRFELECLRSRDNIFLTLYKALETYIDVINGYSGIYSYFDNSDFYFQDVDKRVQDLPQTENIWITCLTYRHIQYVLQNYKDISKSCKKIILGGPAISLLDKRIQKTFPNIHISSIRLDYLLGTIQDFSVYWNMSKKSRCALYTGLSCYKQLLKGKCRFCTFSDVEFNLSIENILDKLNCTRYHKNLVFVLTTPGLHPKYLTIICSHLQQRMFSQCSYVLQVPLCVYSLKTIYDLPVCIFRNIKFNIGLETLYYSGQKFLNKTFSFSKLLEMTSVLLQKNYALEFFIILYYGFSSTEYIECTKNKLKELFEFCGTYIKHPKQVTFVFEKGLEVFDDRVKYYTNEFVTNKLLTFLKELSRDYNFQIIVRDRSKEERHLLREVN